MRLGWRNRTGKMQRRALLFLALLRFAGAASFTATASCGGDSYFNAAVFGCTACGASSLRSADNRSAGGAIAP